MPSNMMAGGQAQPPKPPKMGQQPLGGGGQPAQQASKPAASMSDDVLAFDDLGIGDLLGKGGQKKM